MERHALLESIQRSRPIEFVSGEGAGLRDREGHEYLDFNEIGVVLGQGQDRFTAEMIRALEGITSNKAGLNPYKARLLSYLMETTKGDFQTAHFTSSGSEAVEWAIKLAQKLTGRSEVLSFWNSIHGRTHLSASISGFARRKTDYGPLAAGVTFGIYPDCGHCVFDKAPTSCGYACLEFLDQKIAMESAQDIAAVIIEPFQGAGVIVPPKGYLRALQDWAHERGILLILDEIQSAMGRTGNLYEYQAEGLSPDILLLGKGLGNGLHISALLLKDPVEDKYLHALTGGSGDNVLACAAACAVFSELLDHGLLEHVAIVGEHLRRGLEKIEQGSDVVYEVRCRGLAAAIEFATEDSCRQVRAALTAQRVFYAPYGETSIMLKPPYSVTVEQVDQIMVIIQNVID